MIGNVFFGAIDVIDLLLNGQQIELCFDFEPFNAYSLSNNQILVIFIQHLSIYDENFEEVKKKDKINKKRIIPSDVALDLEKEIAYIADNLNHRILMTDFKLNFIKSVGSGGTKYNPLHEPYSLCLINKNLYVSDYFNKRIQVLSDDLEFVKFFAVDSEPDQIKSLSSMLAVQTSKEIYFYNSTDLSLIQKYNHGSCVISKVNSKIYGFNSEAKKLYCYDENSSLSKEINFSHKLLNNQWDGALLEHNGVLFMVSNTMRKIIKFSKH